MCIVRECGCGGQISSNHGLDCRVMDFGVQMKPIYQNIAIRDVLSEVQRKSDSACLFLFIEVEIEIAATSSYLIATVYPVVRPPNITCSR